MCSFIIERSFLCLSFEAKAACGVQITGRVQMESCRFHSVCHRCPVIDYVDPRSLVVSLGFLDAPPWRDTAARMSSSAGLGSCSFCSTHTQAYPLFFTCLFSPPERSYSLPDNVDAGITEQRLSADVTAFASSCATLFDIDCPRASMTYASADSYYFRCRFHGQTRHRDVTTMSLRETCLFCKPPFLSNASIL